MTSNDRAKPTGLRRLERGVMGLLMGVIAFILEKIVMRSVRREGGGTPSAGGMTVTTKGGEIDVDEL
ncbi:MAG TPA: hypothetical protein VI341_06475 [Actinomycetota bacterium]